MSIGCSPVILVLRRQAFWALANGRDHSMRGRRADAWLQDDRSDAAGQPDAGSPDRHHQVVGHELGRHFRLHRPTHYRREKAGEEVDVRCQIEPAFRRPDVGLADVRPAGLPGEVTGRPLPSTNRQSSCCRPIGSWTHRCPWMVSHISRAAWLPRWREQYYQAAPLVALARSNGRFSGRIWPPSMMIDWPVM